MSFKFKERRDIIKGLYKIVDQIGIKVREAQSSKNRINILYTIADSSDFSKFIEDNFKLKTTLKIRPMPLNAYVFIPPIKMSKSLFPETAFMPQIGSYLDKTGDKSNMKGWVDKERIELGGIFTKILHTMVISEEWFIQGYQKEEIAEVICHEIGHLFSVYETLADSTTMIHTFAEAVKKARGINSKTNEYILQRKGEEDSFYMADNEDIIKINEHTTKDNEDKVTMAVIYNLFQEFKSNSNTSYYDVVTAEAYADQFVVRIGGGRHLAKGLSRIYSSNQQAKATRLAKKNTTLATRVSIFLTELSKIVFDAVLISLFASAIITALFVIFLIGIVFRIFKLFDKKIEGSNYKPNVIEDKTQVSFISEYDNISYRVKRLANDKITQLKLTKDKELAKELISEIDELKYISETLAEFNKDHRETFHAFFSIDAYRGIKKREKIKQLESLLSSDIGLIAKKMEYL